MLEPLGLRWRTERILQLVAELAERNGKVPDTKEELLKLPGVGLYATNAFLSMHIGRKEPVLDGNAVRLWSRIFGFSTDPETRRKGWFIKLATCMTPGHHAKRFNFALLDFTRAVCKLKPLCNKCPLASSCAYYKRTAKP